MLFIIKFKKIYSFSLGKYHFNYLVALVLYYTLGEIGCLGFNVYCNAYFYTDSTFTIDVTSCMDTDDVLWECSITIIFNSPGD